ncbi:MAG: hypothetical protein EVB11_09065 [Winogradskyella sp.]|nr:MAG: hypothetical protein EVB11_09065 [Winogradskyella sp.]
MKSHFLIFIISFFIFNSCNTSTKCDCKKDCSTENLIVITPENSISSENLYAAYLTKEKIIISEKLSNEDSGQLNDEEKEKLKNALRYANKFLLSLDSKIGGGICPPCPDGICCSKFNYFRFNKNFKQVKLTTNPTDKVTLDNQTIIQIRDPKTKEVLTDKVSLKVLNFEGKLVDFNIKIK